MSVTQDYKILTLTVDEWVAVELALESRMKELKERDALISFNPVHHATCMELLADAQSAHAKVRA